MKTKLEKAIFIKNVFGTGANYRCLDGRIVSPSEHTIWQNHFVTQQGVPITDLHLLLVTKMKAAAMWGK